MIKTVQKQPERGIVRVGSQRSAPMVEGPVIQAKHRTPTEQLQYAQALKAKWDRLVAEYWKNKNAAKEFARRLYSSPEPDPRAMSRADFLAAINNINSLCRRECAAKRRAREISHELVPVAKEATNFLLTEFHFPPPEAVIYLAEIFRSGRRSADAASVFCSGVANGSPEAQLALALAITDKTDAKAVLASGMVHEPEAYDVLDKVSGAFAERAAIERAAMRRDMQRNAEYERQRQMAEATQSQNDRYRGPGLFGYLALAWCGAALIKSAGKAADAAGNAIKETSGRLASGGSSTIKSAAAGFLGAAAGAIAGNYAYDRFVRDGKDE